MEGNSAAVPSIVVYVTVPNREAGSVFSLCSRSLALFCGLEFIDHSLASCKLEQDIIIGLA